jgi:putative peptidoglycan lipid II flippase
VIIGVLFAAVPLTNELDERLYAYAIGILLGTVVQFLLPLPWLRGRGGRIGFHLDLRDEAVGRVFLLMLPVTLGLGLINVNILVDSFFAARLSGDLGPASIDKAFRIYMLPQGMFSVAVAAVLFPALSRYAAARDLAQFRHTVSAGLRQIGFLLIPASAACAVLAEPMVRLLYERGEFTPAQTTLVAECLVAFSLGLAFNGAMLLLNRSFFSLQLAWAPTLIALGTLIANAFFDWLFYGPFGFGVWGIPLATSVVNVIGVAALVYYLRQLVGSLDGRATLETLIRIVVASAVLAVVSYVVWRAVDDVVGRSFPAQLFSLLLGISAGTSAFVLAARVLRIGELELVADLIRRRAR